MKSRRLLIALALPLALAAAAPAAPPDNLLENGGFEDSLSGWDFLAAVGWTPDGIANGGAARIRGNYGIVGEGAIVQCFPVTGRRLYDLGADALIPDDSGTTGGVSVRVEFYASGDCSGPVLGGTSSLDFTVVPHGKVQEKELRGLNAPATATSALAVVVAHAEGPGAFNALVDEIFFRPSSDEGEVLTVPTSASGTGARGERFQSDLFVKNTSAIDRPFTLRRQCAAGAVCPTTPVVLRLAPNESRVLTDVMANVFGVSQAAGALEISFDPLDGPLLVTSTVTTVNPDRPGYGTAVPALTRDAARKSATFLGLSGARNPGASRARVNVGAYNHQTVEVTATFLLFDGDGRALGSATRTLAPRSWLQINDIARELGIDLGGTEGAHLTFGATLPVFPFAITVDNGSGDGTYLLPVDAGGAR